MSVALARRWVLHLFSFVLPVTTLAYLLTGPHTPVELVLYAAVVVLSVTADVWSSGDERQPEPMPQWPFDAILYALFALQLVIVALFARHVADVGLLTVDAWLAIVLVGSNSGYSAIVVAHELVHRKAPHHRLMGRVLLVTVLYEHFATEHVRGHHARIGTPEDPATARFGEPFWSFWRRTVPGQFRSAWRLETKRLGDEDMPLWDPRLLRSRVVHGLVAAALLLGAVLAGYGPGALVAWLAQAWLATALLEAVNWFEHWGLVRRRGRVTVVDSWDTTSWFTLYTLVGLSRHADHHAHSNRPYHQLRHFEESPKLPYGYLAMAILALFREARARELMTAELERKRLGPFADGTSPP